MVICQRIIVTQAWKHAEIHEIGPVLKQLTMGNPHGCMAGSFFKPAENRRTKDRAQPFPAENVADANQRMPDRGNNRAE